MGQVYLLLGANLGNRYQQLQSALLRIEQRIGKLITPSSLYETTAWGVEKGPDYLNQVLLIETSLTPVELLEQINTIEQDLGRKRSLRWESRLIDIDILYYEGKVLNNPDLIIPHPYLHLRKFTLVPLVEIAPEFIHPLLNKSNQVILNELKDDLEVRKVHFPEDQD